MRRRRRGERDQRGFSLVELLVVAAVFGLMVLMVDAFFATVNRSSHTVELAADIAQNARVAVERLSREAREASVSQVTVYSSPTMIVLPTARPDVPNDNNFCVDAADANNSGSCNPPSGGYTGASGPARQAWVVYWLEASGSPGTGCASGTGSVYRAYLTQSAAPTSPPSTSAGSVIATCVSTFTASINATTRLVISLTLDTAATVSGTAVPPQTVTVTSTTFMRN